MDAVLNAPRPRMAVSAAPRPLPTPAPAPAVAVAPGPSPAAAPLPLAVVLARSLDAARAAGFSPRGANDLLLLEGIGPRIALRLRAVGLGTFAALAASTPAQLRTLLDVDGSTWLDTWPEQAALAARGQWDALRHLQEALSATA